MRGKKKTEDLADKLVEEAIEKNTVTKSLDVKNVDDVEVFGNGNLFQLLSKASSKSQGWMKSTNAMCIVGVGCLVQVTTQQGDNVAEALQFVPDVRIHIDPDGNKKLVKI